MGVDCVLTENDGGGENAHCAVLHFKTVKSLLNAKTTQALWDVFIGYSAHFGMSRVHFGHTACKFGNFIGEEGDWLVLSSHSHSYIKDQLESGAFHNIPTFRWAVENEGSMGWHWMQETITDFTLARLRQINYKHGIESGITVSLPTFTRREKSVFALSGDEGIA